MEQLDHLFGYFNLVLGTIFILIGFKIYKPFKGEDGEKCWIVHDDQIAALENAIEME